MVTYDSSRVPERRVSLLQLLPRSPMGKLLTVVGLVMVGVLAGFLVRLVVPNHLLKKPQPGRPRSMPRQPSTSRASRPPAEHKR